MIAASKLVLGLVGVGGVALLLSNSKPVAAKPLTPGAKPPTPKALPTAPPPGKVPGPGPGMPPTLVADVEAARALGDPLQLRALAARLTAAGFTGAASDLLNLAQEIERATSPAAQTYTSPGQPTRAKTVPQTVPGKAPVAIPIVLPPAPRVVGAQAPDVRQLQAGQLALSLVGRRAGTEDRAKVKNFQGVNGLKPDGLYGPATALKLAELGIVPPTPFYWPRANPMGAKRAYKAALQAKAQSDSARRQEWTAAANAVRL